MHVPIRFSRPTVATAAALVLLAGLAGSAHGKDADQIIDPTALKSIDGMSQLLAKTKQFSVTIDIAYDIVQDWGQKIEFGETRTLTVRRPDRLRADITSRDGSQSGVIFDGSQIAAFDKKAKVYATTPMSGNLDKTITHFLNDLQMQLPMADVLRADLPKDLKRWARDVRYVEAATIAGTPCDHVAIEGDWEDVQLWIARGDRPLLQRMVITYMRAEGSPQFSAQLRDWNLDAEVSDAVFSPSNNHYNQNYYGGNTYYGGGGYYGGGYYHSDGNAAAAAAVGLAAGMAIGSMVTASQMQSQAQAAGCTMQPVVVNGVTYDQCGSTWYRPVYQGGQVAYQVVSPPH